MWKEYLIDMDNYSEFCRDAILDKLKLIHSDKYIDNQIIKYNNIIKELKEKKKKQTVNPDEFDKILQPHIKPYQKNANYRSQSQRFRFLENKLIKPLRKIGYKGSLEELDSLILNYPQEG